MHALAPRRGEVLSSDGYAAYVHKRNVLKLFVTPILNWGPIKRNEFLKSVPAEAIFKFAGRRLRLNQAGFLTCRQDGKADAPGDALNGASRAVANKKSRTKRRVAQRTI